MKAAKAVSIESAADWLPTASLRPWDKNPRINDGEPVAKVVESIKRFGFGAPIVARKANREIIAGHTRWKAAQAMGLDVVPVRLLDISESEAHLLAVADNRLNEIAQWDLPDLQHILGGYEASAVALAGWSGDDIAKMVATAMSDGEVVEDEIPALPANPVTKSGDIWRLGRHRLICGDCRDASVVRRAVTAPVNVAFTSPPYASQRKYDVSSGFVPIRPDKYVAWFEAVQASVRDVLAPDGSWFVNIKEHSEDGQRSLYVKDLTVAHVRRWGWRFVDELCWRRPSFPGDPSSMMKFKNGWEPVFHYTRDAAFKFRPMHVRHESDGAISYEVQKLAGKQLSAGSQGKGSSQQSSVGHVVGLAYPSNVPDIMEGARVVGHAAAFPLRLPGFFIRAFTDEGDSVLDPFMGAGTTLVAAEELDRSAFGVELSPGYCDLVIERWQNLTGKKAQRGATGPRRRTRRTGTAMV